MCARETVRDLFLFLLTILPPPPPPPRILTAQRIPPPVGQLGYLERENATILNTSILKFARATIRSFKLAMRSLGLSCPLFLTQNDGTVIDASAAERCPIKTFSSGPTNSMTGAAYLAGLGTAGGGRMPDAPVIVVDIGGTTTDVCAL